MSQLFHTPHKLDGNEIKWRIFLFYFCLEKGPSKFTCTVAEKNLLNCTQGNKVFSNK